MSFNNSNCSSSNGSSPQLCLVNFTNSPASSIFVSLLAWLSLIYYPMTAFYEPITLLFGVFNNVLVLLVLLFGRSFREQRSSTSTARLYYIAFAIADIGCVLAIPLLRVLGSDQFALFSVDSTIKQKIN